ncbi:MAG: exonuclease SbcCD subunit D C-terminal domain-containing protein [Gammaproteobacteria bacterium]|nr:exonuclease SbcCD subunit D C-terminal domain-containing protein [Gammaproteobacteria bacterium]
MKILHTSDWHLGRALYGRKRYREFEAFLQWLAETIEQRAVDALLVAGDIFDSSTPSNRAQALYYRFLLQVAESSCRHVVIVAGNHDSPSFLDAPGELLRVLDVHLVGGSKASPEQEVLLLRDAQGAPELIVCAVPYLRDRDIRVVEAGESIVDKELKLVAGIREHYAAVAAVAERERERLGGGIPIVGMGHLFTAGGETVDGDGVRELYVGSLAHVTAAIFPTSFDYLALGHLHVPQRVQDRETLRYSGSPLPMGFGEAGQRKSVCLVDLHGSGSVAATVELVDVPLFQQLERIGGDWAAISGRIRELAAVDSRAWLEIVYRGEEIVGDLRQRLEEAVSGTRMEILRIRNDRVVERLLDRMHARELLEELDVEDVFERCLSAHEVPEAQRPQLLQSYRETLGSLDEDDRRAE